MIRGTGSREKSKLRGQTHGFIPILEGPLNWDEWRGALRPHIDISIWRYMVSDKPSEHVPLPEPRGPAVTMFNPQATSVAELTADERDRFDDEYRIHVKRVEEYVDQKESIQNAKGIILKHVSPEKAKLLDSEASLREWMEVLEKTTAPSMRQRILSERDKYNVILAMFEMEHVPTSDWACQWHTTVKRCHRYNLPEMHSGSWLRDVAYLVLPYSSQLYESFKKGADDLDFLAIEWRKEAEAAIAFKKAHEQGCHNSEDINSIDNNDQTPSPTEPDPLSNNGPEVIVEPELVNPKIWTFLDVFRELRALRHSDRDENPFVWDESSESSRSTSPVSGQFGWRVGYFRRIAAKSPERIEIKTPATKPSKAAPGKCPACGIGGHELRDCWYVFDDGRPKWVVLNASRLARAKKALESDPELRSRVQEMMRR